MAGCDFRVRWVNDLRDDLQADLQADPHETTNLADKPEHAAKLAELTTLLEKERTLFADPAPLKVANPQPSEWSPSKGKKAPPTAPPSSSQ